MKPALLVIGILLIIFGVLTLGYKGFTYNSNEQVAQIGNVQVTANTEKTVYFSPISGALALAGGIVLVLIGRKGGA